MSAIMKSARLTSEEDYLRGELVAETKHEYVGCRVYALVGGSDRHGLLVINLASALPATYAAAPAWFSRRIGSCGASWGRRRSTTTLTSSSPASRRTARY